MSAVRSRIRGRVLVIAPDDTVRHSARRILHDAGASVDVAATERQALTRVLNTSYAVVLVTALGQSAHETAELMDQIQQAGSTAVFLLLQPSSQPGDGKLLDPRIMGVASLEAGELTRLVQHAAEQAFAGKPPSIAPGSSMAATCPVLVLHDDPGSGSDAVRTQLQRLGNSASSLYCVSRAREALELVTARRFAFAIVHLGIADATALDAIHQLYTTDPNLAIIVTTDQLGEVAKQSLACGAQEVVTAEQLDSALGPAIERALLRKAADRDVRYRATHDPMTGLYNRAHFLETTDRALARSRRRHQACAVIYADLDGFKPVNDQFGHAAGDSVLKEVGRRLKASLRESDSAARLGGDEFALLVEDVSDGASIRPLLQRILRQLAQPIRLLDGREVHVAASLGVALCPGDGVCNALAILDAADEAMFSAKECGGNQYCFAAPIDGNGVGSDSLGVEITQSAPDTDYYLLFQPQVDLNTHNVMGLEALLRWHRGRDEKIGPTQFIPLLEQSGRIVEVGAWALREACRSAARWAAQQGRKVRVAVNISPQQLERDGFTAYVEHVIKEAAILPTELELELTEHTLMRDTGRIQNTLQSLRALGVRLVLDDFGTGYASLSYLRKYQIDALKIDRSFTSTLMTEHTSRVLVGSIIDLAHQLGMDVTAEGVEQLAEVRYLRDRGCDACQGYLFGRPHFLGDTRHSDIRRMDPADGKGSALASSPPAETSISARR